MIPEYEIRQMYCDEHMSQKEIAEMCGVDQPTVSNQMKGYGIHTRTRSESQLGNLVKPSEEELRQMYHDKDMSQKEIAKVFGVSNVTISNWMKVCNIQARTNSEVQLGNSVKLTKEELQYMYHDNQMTMSEIAKSCSVDKTTISNWMRLYDIDARILSEACIVKSKRPPKNILKEMYWNNMMSLTEIANEIGVSYGSVLNWMKSYKIKPRTMYELHLGENNGNWNGGISFEPYCEKFNNKFKESVRKRDDYTCQLCRCTQESHGKKLSVHHIHYDKSDCWPDVVALCRSCNTKVNSNRDYWEEYFENQLSERGLTCWSITQET